MYFIVSLLYDRNVFIICRAEKFYNGRFTYGKTGDDIISKTVIERGTAMNEKIAALLHIR